MREQSEIDSPAHERPLYDPGSATADADENLPALSNPALHRYLQEISQYDLLSREEADELALHFQQTGDPEAAYRLISSNLRLVVKVAMDFQKYWMQNFMDLIQEGNVGLMQANSRYWLTTLEKKLQIIKIIIAQSRR